MIENLTKSLDVQRKLIFNLNEVSNLATNGDPAACATRSGWRNTCDQDARGAHVMIGVKYFQEYVSSDCLTVEGIGGRRDARECLYTLQALAKPSHNYRTILLRILVQQGPPRDEA